jgi:hypothetical protein
VASAEEKQIVPEKEEKVFSAIESLQVPIEAK